MLLYVEMRRRVRLQSLRHRLPEDFDVGPDVDDLLEGYDRWVMSWVLVPEPSPEQLKLPDGFAEAAGEIAAKLPDVAKRFRTQLGEGA